MRRQSRNSDSNKGNERITFRDLQYLDTSLNHPHIYKFTFPLEFPLKSTGHCTWCRRQNSRHCLCARGPVQRDCAGRRLSANQRLRGGPLYRGAHGMGGGEGESRSCLRDERGEFEGSGRSALPRVPRFGKRVVERWIDGAY